MKQIIDILLSIFFWIAGLLTFLLWSIVLLLVGAVHTGRFFEWLVKLMCRSMVFVCGIRIRKQGVENYDRAKQYILMMNHVNLFDAFVFYSQFPGNARGVEEESHFKWPVYGWVNRRIGNIPISRKKARRALDSLKKAASLIRSREDFSFIVLPEGTRTITGKLGNFKKGGFLLALEAGLDILPLVQVGSFKIKQKKSWLVRPGKVKFIIEKAIPTSGYTRETIRDLMEKVRAVFLKYTEGEDGGGAGKPAISG